LEPLLEDFTYWFSRSRLLLESERLSFLSLEEQDDLLARVKNAQQEVATAHLLFKTTGGQVGIQPRCCCLGTNWWQSVGGSAVVVVDYRVGENINLLKLTLNLKLFW
jgi:hypothetical protein